MDRKLHRNFVIHVGVDVLRQYDVVLARGRPHTLVVVYELGDLELAAHLEHKLCDKRRGERN